MGSKHNNKKWYENTNEREGRVLNKKCDLFMEWKCNKRKTKQCLFQPWECFELQISGKKRTNYTQSQMRQSR